VAVVALHRVGRHARQGLLRSAELGPFPLDHVHARIANLHRQDRLRIRLIG
jgi:hypothetical protein